MAKKMKRQHHFADDCLGIGTKSRLTVALEQCPTQPEGHVDLSRGRFLTKDNTDYR